VIYTSKLTSSAVTGGAGSVTPVSHQAVVVKANCSQQTNPCTSMTDECSRVNVYLLYVSHTQGGGEASVVILKQVCGIGVGDEWEISQPFVAKKEFRMGMADISYNNLFVIQ
jgi:hypothetical protein